MFACLTFMWCKYKILNDTRSLKWYYNKVKGNKKLNACGIIVSSNVPININTIALLLVKSNPKSVIQNIQRPYTEKYLDLLSC